METSYVDKIRKLSEQLLTDETVDMVIGFQKGSLPMSNEPVMIKHPPEVEKLVWDSHCNVNLASYLTDRKEKIGVIAKGCDSRNIANHIIENKISRDQLTIIGIPCQGMVDRTKVAKAVDFEIFEFIEASGRVIVKGAGVEKRFNKMEILQDNCAVCMYPNPVLYDELVGEPVEARESSDQYADVAEIEALDTDEKWAYFEDLLSNCIRCYACRNACPLCYCPTCFVDETQPQWVGKSDNTTDIRTFHFLRAYHCAGRCTDCGSCERVCPMGIKMRALTRKLQKDCQESFDWQAGLNTEQRPPLDRFSPTDPDQFVK